MITKERLEELIEQGATIWGVYDYSYSYDKPNKKVEFIDLDGFYNYYKDIDEFIMYQGDYSELFETEEEAKWFAEFGCIERTERLEFPTWEEFKNKKTKHVCFMGKDTFCFFELYEDKQKNRLILLDHDCDYEYFNEELTKENYTTACGLCKEFFLGEKK